MVLIETRCLQFFNSQTIVFSEHDNRWCNRENVEPDALKEWKINIFFKLLILVYDFTFVILVFGFTLVILISPQPKSSFRHLNRGIQDAH